MQSSLKNDKIKFMKKIIIYTTPTCVYCKMTKEFFAENKISYEEKDVSTDSAGREEMLKKSGQMGVPVIDIDGEIVIGFDEERLRGLIGIK